mgnify:CR=1 FL=1
MKTLHLLPLLLLPALGHAQSHSIDGSTIDGGGGTSTGGVYQVSGTLGQPDASGPMTNGPDSLVGGFWALPILVPTPGAPLLSIPFTHHASRFTSAFARRTSSGVVVRRNNAGAGG